MALLRDNDDRRRDPPEIKALLTGLKNGSGSWLDFLGAALREADLPREDRHLLYGAFCMARAFLADIEGGDGRLGASLSADPAHDCIAATTQAITTLVTGSPTPARL